MWKIEKWSLNRYRVLISDMYVILFVFIVFIKFYITTDFEFFSFVCIGKTHGLYIAGMKDIFQGSRSVNIIGSKWFYHQSTSEIEKLLLVICKFW